VARRDLPSGDLLADDVVVLRHLPHLLSESPRGDLLAKLICKPFFGGHDFTAVLTVPTNRTSVTRVESTRQYCLKSSASSPPSANVTRTSPTPLCRLSGSTSGLRRCETLKDAMLRIASDMGTSMFGVSPRSAVARRPGATSLFQPSPSNPTLPSF